MFIIGELFVFGTGSFNLLLMLFLTLLLHDRGLSKQSRTSFLSSPIAVECDRQDDAGNAGLSLSEWQYYGFQVAVETRRCGRGNVPTMRPERPGTRSLLFRK